MSGRQQKRILIVSDLPPGTLGGAQTIIQIVSEATTNFRIEYAIYPPKINTLSRKGRFHRIEAIKGVINPYGYITLTWKILRKKPDVIWFHNINRHWSWCVLLVPKFSANKVITLHDLTALSNYKITKNSGWDSANFNSTSIPVNNRIRNLLIKKFLLRARTVGIGDICVNLLKKQGIRVDFVIPNRIEPCHHKKRYEKLPGTVLFAGRQNLKGLNLISKAVADTPGWRLIIAGEEDAYKESLEFCSSSKITYLGVLPREELLKVIHQVELVAVCSQYYDNFPTIGLEALVHNSLPVTTKLTGIATLIGRISQELVINENECPALDKLNLLTPHQVAQKEVIISEITDLNAFASDYLEVMNK